MIYKPLPPRPRGLTRTQMRLMGWADDDGDTARTAYVEERPDMEDTGLLDAEGRRLYREREPMGFKPR